MLAQTTRQGEGYERQRKAPLLRGAVSSFVSLQRKRFFRLSALTPAAPLFLRREVDGSCGGPLRRCVFQVPGRTCSNQPRRFFLIGIGCSGSSCLYTLRWFGRRLRLQSLYVWHAVLRRRPSWVISLPSLYCAFDHSWALYSSFCIPFARVCPLPDPLLCAIRTAASRACLFHSANSRRRCIELKQREDAFV